jgi:ubiquinone biosynthesis protein
VIARIRGTVWVILLWTVLVAIFIASAVTGDVCVGMTGADLAACRTMGDDIYVVAAIAFVVVWSLGTIVLLATRPGGGVRAFIVQVLVNTFAMIATLLLLSLVQLPVTNPDGTRTSIPLLVIPGDLLQIGIVIALVNALVRPLLLAITGRWILRSLGLAIIVINAVLFWLVSEISRLMEIPWQVPDPWPLWIFIDSLVFTLILAILNAFLGLGRPRLDSSGSGAIWRFIDRLPAQRRNAIIENIRLQEVYDSMSRFSLEIIVGGSALAPIRRLGDRFQGRSGRDIEAMSTPAKVRLMLQQLGPTYVKLGQMVSSRADALPAEWRTELDKLQSTVPPFPWESARRIIATELGSDPDELFGSIEAEPFAAASLAQVHRATLKDGRAVVVKVQRPDVQAKVRADLGVIAELAQVAESRSALARRLDAVGLVKEFSDGVIEELDYTVEAYHARRLADVVASIDGVGAPTLYPELSTGRVLTMDFVPGVKATKADQLDPSIDRDAVARTFIRATIKQVLVDGFFHADPHPGNIMLDTQTGKLTFLDLGLVGELRQEQRFDLLALLWALRMEDPQALASVARRLCVATGPVDETAYQTAVERLFYQYWVYGSSSFSRMMSALFATLGAHNLRMRRELTLAVKAMTQSEELMRAIDPDMPLVRTAAEEAEQLLRQQFTPERIGKVLRGQLADVVQDAMGRASDVRAELIPVLLAAVTGGRIDLAPTTPDRLALGSLETRVDGLGRTLERQGRQLATIVGLVGLSLSLAVVMLALFLAPEGPFPAVDLAAAGIAAIGVGALALTLWRWRSDGRRSDWEDHAGGSG